MPPNVSLALSHLKEIFTTIMRSLKEDDTSLKAVQKLLITVWEKEIIQHRRHVIFFSNSLCFMLLVTFLFSALMGLVQQRNTLEKTSQQLYHQLYYINRPSSPQFQDMTLLHFTQYYKVSNNLSSKLSCRKKKVVVIVRPYCSSNPHGPQYEQYLLPTEAHTARAFSASARTSS